MGPFENKPDEALGLRQPLSAKDVLWGLSPALLCMLLTAMLLAIGTRTFPDDRHFLALFPKFAIYPSIPVAFAVAIYLRRRYGKAIRSFTQMSDRELLENFWCGVSMVWPIISGLVYRVFVELHH
jgi:hypothetical protein